jgi:branched-chain amino acid transport system substrate-binding protein
VKSITEVSDTVIYSPRTRDFTSTLEKLNSSVSSLIDTYGEKNVCVFAISIDEISDLLAQASAYPNLRKIQWSGMDGVGLNPTIIKNETAAQLAYDTHLATISFNVAQPEDSNYWKVYDTIQATTDGHQPCIYEILPYDEVVMAARILENNASTLEENLNIADILGNNMYGATGWLKLDKNGDREYGDYYFYLPQKGPDGKLKWVPCFAYLNGLNTTIPLTGVNNTLLEKTLTT